MLTRANLKSRYRKTFAGFVWVVLNPILLFGAQSYAFSKILKIQVPGYSEFLLAGLLPWIFVSQSVDMCTSIFVNSGRLLKSFPLHPLVLLCAQLLDNLVNFLAAFLLILIPFLVMSPIEPRGVLALPLALFFLAVGALGFSWLLATVQVFFRDTRYLVSFGLNVAFYLTPIFYPLSFVPERIRGLVAWNPIYLLISPFQLAVGDSGAEMLARALAMSGLVAFGMLGIAAWAWSLKRNHVYLSI